MKQRITLFLLFIISSLSFGQYIETRLYSVKAYVMIYEHKSDYLSNESDYKAVIEPDNTVSSRKPAGNVRLLLKKISLSDIGTGTFRVSFTDIGSNLYRIDGTNYVLETDTYINTYTDYALHLSGYSASIKKINPF